MISHYFDFKSRFNDMFIMISDIERCYFSVVSQNIKLIQIYFCRY